MRGNNRREGKSPSPILLFPLTPGAALHIFPPRTHARSFALEHAMPSSPFPTAVPMHIAPPAPAGTWRERRGPSHMRWWYAGIADMMLAHPDWTQIRIAQELGRTREWVGLIINSDFFRAYFEQRRAEYNANLAGQLTSKLNEVAIAGLDIIQERLESDQRRLIPLDVVADITTKTLGSLGYGAKAPPGVQIVNNNHGGNTIMTPVSAEELALARNQLRSRESELATIVPATIEGE